MKTYYIINYQTDEVLGTVRATDILSAELKACEIWADIPSTNLLAFTEI
jgi:hypothetical protein